MESENNALPLQPGVFEVQDYADAQFCNAKIIQHLAALVVSDSL
jgi:hypothetical protein